MSVSNSHSACARSRTIFSCAAACAAWTAAALGTLPLDCCCDNHCLGFAEFQMDAGRVAAAAAAGALVAALLPVEAEGVDAGAAVDEERDAAAEDAALAAAAEEAAAMVEKMPAG